MIFAIHQHESAACIHVSPHPEPSSHLPSHTIPLGCPRALTLGVLLHALNLHWLSFYIWWCTCFSAILSNHPTFTFSHWVQKSVLYICVSFVALHVGLSLPSSLFSVAQSCPTLCDAVDWSMPDFPVLHHVLELAQTHVHWVSDAIQPFCPLSSPSPPAFSLS